MSLHQLKIDLFAGIKRNDLKKVRNILLKNPYLVNNPKCIDRREATPLWRAILEGHEDIVELLVRDFGADPDEKCGVKRFLYVHHTYLQYAAGCDQYTTKVEKVAGTLIKHGANVNACYGTVIDTPLEIALREGNAQFAELLLTSGAQLRPERKNYIALLMRIFRLKKSRKIILKLLLRCGLYTSIDNESGKNLLHIFTAYSLREDDHYHDAIEIAEILTKRSLGGVPVNQTDSNGLTPLHYSIVRQHLPLVSFLIRKGADVNFQDKILQSPLFLATVSANLDLIILLLSNGADINAKNRCGWTALYLACFKRNKEVIGVLLENGADLSVVNDSGVTPFLQLHPENFNRYSDGCISLMIEEFSKLSFENISISEEDMNLINAFPTVRDYFESCKIELKQMANINFYAEFSYYSILKMSKNIKRLAHLTKNKKFIASFETNLDSFPYYKKHLLRIWAKAVQVKGKIDAVESVLKNIFGKYLPEIVIRILSDYLNLEDLPVV